MSADDRRYDEGASSQVEDRFEGKPPAGYAAGAEGGGSEVWEKVPAASGGWEIFATRGGEREAARRRVEAHPEVMPPHPQPTDRAEVKKRVEMTNYAMHALPVALCFVAGLLLPQLFAPRAVRRRRHVAAPVLTLALRARGRRARREAMRLAELLRGHRFRGELLFE